MQKANTSIRVVHLSHSSAALNPVDNGVLTLAALAGPLGLRVYRDPCGDENVPGRFGEIYRHSPGLLAVQLGGQLANGKPLAAPRRIRCRIALLNGTPQIRLLVRGDEEAVFVFPEALLPEIATRIWAYREYRKSGRPK